MIRRTSLPARSSVLPRSTKPIRRRKKRTAAEEREKFEREFGGEDRRKFVSWLPCSVPACHVQPCVNHHTENEGKSRKGHHTTIAPLCDAHHHELHDGGVLTFEAKYGVSMENEARLTERAWQLFLSGDF